MKFTSPGNAGVPDRILINPQGMLWFVELKKDNASHPRALQLHWANKLEGYHQNVAVIHSKQTVDWFLDNVTEMEGDGTDASQAASLSTLFSGLD